MTVRLGLIGAGLVVRRHHLPALSGLGNRFVVTAVASRRDSARTLAADLDPAPAVYRDAADLLTAPDVDAVLIAVPIPLTAELTRQALEAGKHVIAEKPIAHTVAEAEDLCALAEESDRVYLVCENFRYQRRFQQARSLIESGLVGTPRVYELHDVFRMTPDNPNATSAWRHDLGLGGYMLDTGVHWAAAFQVVAGEPIVRVSAETASFNSDLLGGEPDTLIANLVLKGGALGRLFLSYALTERRDSELAVYGSEGTLVVQRQRWTRQGVVGFADVARLSTPARPGWNNLFTSTRLDTGFREAYLDFHRAITTRATVRCTPRAATTDLRVVEAMIEAARTHRVLPVEG